MNKSSLQARAKASRQPPFRTPAPTPAKPRTVRRPGGWIRKSPAPTGALAVHRGRHHHRIAWMLGRKIRREEEEGVGEGRGGTALLGAGQGGRHRVGRAGVQIEELGSPPRRVADAGFAAHLLPHRRSSRRRRATSRRMEIISRSSGVITAAGVERRRHAADSPRGIQVGHDGQGGRSCRWDRSPRTGSRTGSAPGRKSFWNRPGADIAAWILGGVLERRTAIRTPGRRSR